jgi:hypothetical protein
MLLPSPVPNANLPSFFFGCEQLSGIGLDRINTLN